MKSLQSSFDKLTFFQKTTTGKPGSTLTHSLNREFEATED